MDRVLLIDGNNLLYRLLRAKRYPALSTSTGENTGPAYGFCLSLHKLAEAFLPDRMAITFDGGLSKRRQELYPAYKERAVPTPEVQDERDTFRHTVARVGEIMSYLSIPVVRVPYEADDVLEAMVHGLVAWYGPRRIVVVSQDLDLVQMVNPDYLPCSVELYQPIHDRTVTLANVREVLGYDVGWYAHYKAIVGKLRETPGVEGVGEQTAIEFLASLPVGTDLREAAEQHKSKRIKRIAEQYATVELGVKLSRLGLETFAAPFEKIIMDAVRALGEPVQLNRSALTNLFTELEFHSLLDKPGWAEAFAGGS